MPVMRSLRVVNAVGSAILDVDDQGVKDGLGRITLTLETVTDRLFATPLAAYMWTAVEGTWAVAFVNAKYSVVGGASCTCDVLVCPGITAPGSGTTQLTAVLDLTATAPASRNGTIIATPTRINPGDSVARVIAGTPGSLEGCLTVTLRRIS